MVKVGQSAGVLVRDFAPLNGPPTSAEIVNPQEIYVAAAPKETSSLRPRHTVLELAGQRGCVVPVHADALPHVQVGARGSPARQDRDLRLRSLAPRRVGRA